jgi:hypothetical protein
MQLKMNFTNQIIECTEFTTINEFIKQFNQLEINPYNTIFAEVPKENTNLITFLRSAKYYEGDTFLHNNSNHIGFLLTKNWNDLQVL